MKTLKLLLVVVFAAAWSSSILAQAVSPIHARGFEADKVYAVDDIDAVNLLNGNVNVPIPLGIKYSVGPQLSYQFTLVYGGNNWESESYDELPNDVHPNQTWTYTWAYPSWRDNAGLGWRLTLGRLYGAGASGCTPPGTAGLMAYESPDGSVHCFYTALHEGHTEEVGTDTYYTRDSTYLRLQRYGSSQWQVEFPDGIKYIFDEPANTTDSTGATGVVRMEDRHNNWVRINYHESPTVAPARQGPTGTIWSIEDSFNRKHYIYFRPTVTYWEAMQGVGIPHEAIAEVRLAGPQSSTAIYQLHYVGEGGSWASIQRPPWPEGSHQFSQIGTAVSVALLDHLDQPADGPYIFGYLTNLSYDLRTGALNSMQLPTGGRIEWSSAPMLFPNFNGFWSPALGVDTLANQSVVIERRTRWEGNKRVAIRTFMRTSQPSWPIVMDDNVIVTDFKPPQSDDPAKSPEEAGWSIIRKSQHFFSVCVQSCTTPIKREFGLPLSRIVRTTPAAESDGSSRYLSSVDFGPDSNGNWTNVLKKTYVAYEADVALATATGGKLDANRRQYSQRTYTCRTASCVSDTGATGWDYVDVVQNPADFDGLGHYRTATTSSSFDSQQYVQKTNYNPAAGAYPSSFVMPYAATWLTNLYTQVESSVGSEKQVTQFYFDGTGFLLRKRQLKNRTVTPPATTPSLSPNDVLVVFSPNSYGQVAAEEYYGGDENPDTPESEAIGAQTIDSSSLTLGRMTAAIDYDNYTPVQCLFRAKFRGSNFYSQNFGVDCSTGMASSSTDPSGVVTLYDYDSVGRLMKVQPTGAPTTTYQYCAVNTGANCAAGSAANARVKETVTGTDGAAGGVNTYEYDAWGRLLRASTAMANNNLAVGENEYDVLGRKIKASQPAELPAHSAISGGNWTTTAFDPLGRAISVTGPDGSQSTFGYTGVSSLARISSVATSTTGSASVTTTESYDALGRIKTVQENSVNTSATAPIGGLATTTYGYDVGGNLVSVGISNGSFTQPRSFAYDGRGFLNSETHPENGTTTYDVYDARGHAHKRTVGGRTLKFDYDVAERVVKVAEGTSSVKDFTFGGPTSAGDADLHLGKLVTAVRHNYLTSAGQIDVTETYEYAKPGGKMSKRQTLVEKVNSDNSRSTIQKFEYKVDYDAFALPKTIDMPTCISVACSVPNGSIPSVQYERNNRILTKVTGFGELTYHPSGMVKTVAHLPWAAGQPPTDTYSAVNGMARPSSIQFGSGNSTCAPISPSPITAPASVVANSTGNIASVPARADITHTWQISGGVITSSATGDFITFTADASGSVTLLVTPSSNGCGGTSSNSTIPITNQSCPFLDPSEIHASSSVFANSTQNNASVTPRSGISHQWQISGGTITSSTSGDSVSFTAGASGSVTLTVTASDGCSSINSTVDVAIAEASCPAVPGFEISYPYPAPCPNQNNRTASVPVNSALTYTFSLTGGTLLSTTDHTVTFKAGASGTVKITAVGRNSCGNAFTAKFPIPIQSLTTPTINAVNAVCAGSTSNIAWVAPEAGFVYSWQVTGGTLTSMSGVNNSTITFDAGSSGTVTLTVQKASSCGTFTASKTIAIEETPVAPLISAPSTVCASSSGNQASVPPQAGITHTWQITGGTITSATTGEAIAFQAAASGSVVLTVTSSNSCSSQTPATITIPVGVAPTQSTISAQSTVHAGATGTASVPARSGITHTWQITGGTITSAVTGENITFQAGSSGSISLTVTAKTACNLSASSTATVGIILPPPATVSATTQSNRIVQVSWAAVPNAASYRIERAVQLNGQTVWSTTVNAPATSYTDETPASSLPVTYIYYVRAVDSANVLSDRGPFDDATTATQLYAQPTLTPLVTPVKAMDVVELRRAIDALRYAVNLPPVFQSTPAPSGVIYATHFTALINALSPARTALGRAPFVYVNNVPLPATGGPILAEQVRQLREALR